jgi:hypothetical protein
VAPLLEAAHTHGSLAARSWARAALHLGGGGGSGGRARGAFALALATPAAAAAGSSGGDGGGEADDAEAFDAALASVNMHETDHALRLQCCALLGPRLATRSRAASRWPCSQAARTAKPDGKRRPKTFYTTASIRRAISRACDKAKVPDWSTMRLRHNAGTEARQELGLDAAQARLGHKQARITEVYAEVADSQKRKVARILG